MQAGFAYCDVAVNWPHTLVGTTEIHMWDVMGHAHIFNEFYVDILGAFYRCF